MQKHYDDLFPPLSSASPASIAAAALYLSNRDFSHYTSLGHQSAWTSPKLAGFRLGGVEANRYERRFELGGKDEEVVQVSVAPSMGATGALDVSVSDNAGQESVLFSNLAFSTSTSTSSNPAATTVKTSLPSHRVEVDIVSSPAPPLPLTVEQQPEVLTIFNTAEGFAGKVEVKPPAWMAKVGTAVGEAGKGKGAGGVVAPMRSCFSSSFLSSKSSRFAYCAASKVVQVFVKAGDVVAEGAPLVMLEAMKTVRPLSSLPSSPSIDAGTSTLAGARPSRVRRWHRCCCQGQRRGPRAVWKGSCRIRGSRGGSSRGREEVGAFALITNLYCID